jgi:hypothetical protein
VPDWFAAAFIEQLYERLLDKDGPKPLGQSLMETRRHFWNKERNVLGLAYALYSSPDIQFIGWESIYEKSRKQQTIRNEVRKSR